MKKQGILNSDISRVLSYMEHTDTIAIGDCGLPIPEGTERIDLALTFGVPSFIDVLKCVVVDCKVEKITLATEIKEQNQAELEQINDIFKDTGVEVCFVPHEELKRQTKDCKAVIRMGETTPYANIILQSGCIFA